MMAAAPIKRRKWTPKRVLALASKVEAYARAAFDREGEMKGLNFVGPELPTVAHCLKKNRVSASVAYELAREYPRLADALKKIKDAQQHLLVNFTLRGGYASTFAIFAAKNMIGWRDEQKGPVVDNSKHLHVTMAALAKEVSSDGNDGLPEGMGGDVLEAPGGSGFVFTEGARRAAVGQADRGDGVGSGQP